MFPVTEGLLTECLLYLNICNELIVGQGADVDVPAAVAISIDYQVQAIPGHGFGKKETLKNESH